MSDCESIQTLGLGTIAMDRDQPPAGMIPYFAPCDHFAVASLYGLLGKIARDMDHAGEGSSQQDGKRKRASQKGKPAQKPGTAKAGAEQGGHQRNAEILQQATLRLGGSESLHFAAAC